MAQAADTSTDASSTHGAANLERRAATCQPPASAKVYINERAGCIFFVLAFLLFLLALMTGRNDRYEDWWWLGHKILYLSAACMVVAVLRLIRATLPMTIKAGSDGVLLSRWGWRKRFIAYAQIESVTTEAVTTPNSQKTDPVSFAKMTIQLTTGKPWTAHAVPAKFKDLKQAMVQSLERYRHYQENSATFEELERQGRPVEHWVDELRAAAAGAQRGHRYAAISRDEMWQALSDPSKAVGQRAALAFALGQGADEEEKKLLQGLADSTLSPKLRSVLQGLAREQLDEIGALNAIKALGP